MYRSFINVSQKSVFVINDTEYEVSEITQYQDNSDTLSAAQIAELDADPEIAKMIRNGELMHPLLTTGNSRI